LGISKVNVNDTLDCLYVSNVAPYKHQWMVIKAVAKLKGQGYDIKLTLIGGGRGKAQVRLWNEMQQSDPEGIFVKQEAFVPHNQIPVYLAKADIYLFASSCENMPIILLEIMASGLPIVCSSKEPMPEILGDAGIYFNPERPVEIAGALLTLINSSSLRSELAQASFTRSQEYSWERCANETFGFLNQVVKEHKGKY
jgi:glycosyltransferase involved in cell wall biosynthesis